jgi:hypothetical protein
MPRRNTGAVMLALVGVILLAIFVPPEVSLNRFKKQIESSLERALARDVRIGEVDARLLPRPGFVLNDLTIADDPSFSAEPVLHASQATAYLRITSLWQGRLEIARLELSDPSLNLVRRADGRWNVETLIQRASQTPTAPTALTRAQAHPRFPYIEATGGRINFKFGLVKREFALTDTDFSLWLESEDQWNLRLKTTPTRTDQSLTDIGPLRAEGSFQRAAEVMQTPIKLHATWEDSQLGSLTALLLGRDAGWRGNVAASAEVEGTPAQLAGKLRLSADNFRRFDIGTNDSLRLSADCSANYRRAVAQSPEAATWDCAGPLGSGTINARGSYRWSTPRGLDAAFAAVNVPASAALRLLQRVKNEISPSLSALGEFNGNISLHKSDQPVDLMGTLTLSDAAVEDDELGKLNIGSLRLASAAAPASPRKSRATPQPATGLTLTPVKLDLGDEDPAIIGGSLSGTDARLTLSGGAELPRLLALAHAFGVRAPAVNLKGAATLNLEVAHEWGSFSAPVVTGTAQLRRASAQVLGIGAPVEVRSAFLTLEPESVKVQKLEGSFASTPLTFMGSLELTRNCESFPQCPVRFDLSAPQLSLEELNALFNPAATRSSWLPEWFGRSSSEPSIFLRLNAQGRLAVAHLSIKKLMATNVSADATLREGKLTFSDVRAQLFNGKHTGTWTADFSQSHPQFTGKGEIRSASVNALMSEFSLPAAKGSADATYTLSLSGTDRTAVAAGAVGSVTFDWNGGAFAAAAGAPREVRFAHWQGSVEIANGAANLVSGEMLGPGVRAATTGELSFARELKLTLSTPTQETTFTGPLQRLTASTSAASTTEAASNQKNAELAPKSQRPKPR